MTVWKDGKQLIGVERPEQEVAAFISAEERKREERYGYFPKLHPSEWQDAQPEQEPVQRPWVGLTDGELMECTVFKHFDYDPPYIDKNGAKHVGSTEVSLRATYENINNKLREKNS
jgi:hypothetical protein